MVGSKGRKQGRDWTINWKWRSNHGKCWPLFCKVLFWKEAENGVVADKKVRSVRSSVRMKLTRTSFVHWWHWASREGSMAAWHEIITSGRSLRKQERIGSPVHPDTSLYKAFTVCQILFHVLGLWQWQRQARSLALWACSVQRKRVRP